MTVRELEEQLLRLSPTDKLRIIQLLAESLNALWTSVSEPPATKLSEFFRQSPLAQVAATGELDRFIVRAIERELQHRQRPRQPQVFWAKVASIRFGRGQKLDFLPPASCLLPSAFLR